MRDEDFMLFIEEFGEATHRVEVPETAFDLWRSRLPDKLLTYWREEGWCSYANGLFWSVDPSDYEDLVGEWLEDSPLEQIDVFHAIGRTAFGDIYLFGEKTGSSVNIAPSLNAIFALSRDLVKKSQQDLDRSARIFFSGKDRGDCDLDDESGEPLFERSLNKLGPLAPDEMYGFEPALVAGGRMLLENLQKVNLDVHLTILRQMATPIMPYANIDVDKLMQRMK